jgi:hypothetical protein
MQVTYRHVSLSPNSSSSAGPNNFCVCRMLADFALVNLKAVADLHAAKKLMRRMAARVPGSYLIFNRKTRQVLGKIEAVNHARM